MVWIWALYYNISIKDSMVVYNSVKPEIADLFLIKCMITIYSFDC